MATSYTSLLGLALPVQGELSGTWGDTVNDYITKYVDASVAGTQTISGSQTAVTLSTTTGTTLGQAGSGATGSAQYMIINCTGNPASLLTITAPATSKVYVVINATSTAQSVKIVGTGPTTGVTIASAEKAVVAWNGSDFVRVGGTGDAVLANNNAFTGANTFYNSTGQTFGTGTAAQDGMILAGRAGGTSTYRVTLTPATLTASRTLTLPDNTGTVLTTGAAVTVAQGGTGLTTLTANNVILGNGTSTPTFVAPGTSGNVLTSNGTTWTSAAASASLLGDTDSATPFETSLGFEAGNSTTGVNNTFIGYQAGKANTTGTDNVAVGYQALDVNTIGVNNVAIGSGALGANTTGTDNTAVGQGALSVNTTGSNNIGLGRLALSANTTGNQNVAIGSLALDANTGGSLNVAVGHGSLGANTTGAQNVAFGGSALGDNTVGTNNVAIGQSALTKNTTGTDNTAVGHQALDANTTGVQNTAIGSAALGANIEGSNNTAIGYAALLVATTAAYNVAIGRGALESTTTGGSNVAVGGLALNVNTTGTDNVAVGFQALDANTTGVRNVAIGLDSLGANTTGTNNVALGYSASAAATTGTQNTIIGSQAGFSGTNNLTTGSNNTIIGYNAAASSATISNEITLGNASIATIRAQVTTITALSDARDKRNISDLPAGLNFVNELRPVAFEWAMRDGAKVGVPDTGFIAQDLKAVQEQTGITIPGLVYESNPDRLEAGYGKLLPVLVKAIQELSAKVDALESQLKGN